MRIGIDIDNTVSDTLESIYKYTEMYDKKYKEGKGIINPDIYNFAGKYDWTEEDKKDFLSRYIEKITSEACPVQDAVEIINKLKEEENEIYFITNRKRPSLKGPYESTKEWLNKHNILYDKLIVDSGLKGIVCKENYVELLIDDRVDQCEDVLSYGIKALLFDTRENKGSKLERVNDWKEIYELLRK